MTSMGLNFNYKQPTYPSLRASAPGVTGTLMILIMTFSFTLATHSFRRSVVKLPSPLHHLAGFNAFWYAHQLLALVYSLLVVHSYFIFLTKKWYKKTVCYAFSSGNGDLKTCTTHRYYCLDNDSLFHRHGCTSQFLSFFMPVRD